MCGFVFQFTPLPHVGPCVQHVIGHVGHNGPYDDFHCLSNSTCGFGSLFDLPAAAHLATRSYSNGMRSYATRDLKCDVYGKRPDRLCMCDNHTWTKIVICELLLRVAQVHI